MSQLNYHYSKTVLGLEMRANSGPVDVLRRLASKAVI